jgi:hypothetical protein
MKSKISLFFILMLIANVGCKSKNADGDTTKKTEEVVRYDIKIRGTFRTFVITPNLFSVVLSDGKIKASGEITPEQWNQLTTAIKASEPNKWSTYEAPSNRRATDRAGTAQVHYAKGNTKHASELFDHGQPPLDLKEVVAIILELSKKYD